MVKPEEKETIIGKIAVIAREGRKFNGWDCIHKHSGVHFIDDWVEVLEELVESGYLRGEGKGFDSRLYQLVKEEDTVWYKVGDRCKVVDEDAAHSYGADNVRYGDEVEVIFIGLSGEPRVKLLKGSHWFGTYILPIESLELMKEDTVETSAKLVYKVMRIEDGEMKSVWAGIPFEEGCFTDAKGIVYKEGKIAYAPKGQQGLSTFDELPEAIAFAESQVMDYKKVIHEAVPLGSRGERLGCSSSWGQTAATYPAVLIGKEVWMEEELRPEPKFKEGDGVKVTNGCYKGKSLVITGAKWADMGHEHWHYYSNTTAAPIDEWWLELAPPVEEWADVGTFRIYKRVEH